jgi:hypothetical protein
LVIVFFRRAACWAFLMFFLAAVVCLRVAMTSPPSLG